MIKKILEKIKKWKENRKVKRRLDEMKKKSFGNRNPVIYK
jgi:putative component of toxin-antitoxin plasmid stabilization module|tara:strand:- start:486 stop:605 length:120 start_codon:yes stop_codon:yes gene_type:complete